MAHDIVVCVIDTLNKINIQDSANEIKVLWNVIKDIIFLNIVNVSTSIVLTQKTRKNTYYIFVWNWYGYPNLDMDGSTVVLLNVIDKSNPEITFTGSTENIWD